MNTKPEVRKSVLIFAAAGFFVALLILSSFFSANKAGSPISNISGKKSSGPAKVQEKPTKENHFEVEGAQENRSIEYIAEQYYQSVPFITGLPPGDTLGQDKIKIIVFDSKEEYVKETGKPAWSEGFADAKSKEIFLIQSEGLEKSVLPHEISHLFFDSYLGYESNEVNWLDEGLATLVQVKYDQEQAASFNNVMNDIRNNGHIPLAELQAFVLSPQTPESQINKYYAETLSITHYLLNQDFVKWKELLEKLKSKDKFNRALQVTFDKDVGTLEEDWLSFIKANRQSWEKT